MAKELTELRAWAVEQAVAVFDRVGVAITTEGGEPVGLTRTADHLLSYILTPAQEANRELLDAARSFDGRQDAGALIGLLADALEQAMGARS